MTASRNNRRHRLWIALTAGLALLATVGCQSTPPRTVPTAATMLEPMRRARSPLPLRRDRAAAELLEASLGASQQEVARSLYVLEMTDPRLAPLGRDLANASLDDPTAYREASKKLLAEGNADPLLEKRLEAAVDSDPLQRADRHIFDHRHTLFAHTFNAIAEPLGTSVLSGLALAPYKIAVSVLQWAVRMLEVDPLSLPERQALVLRRHFLDAHPDAPEAPKVREQIVSAERDLHETRARSLAGTADAALEAGQPRLAEVYAKHAQREVQGASNVVAIGAQASSQIARQRRLRHRSLQANTERPTELSHPPERPRTLAAGPGFEAELSELAMRRPVVVRRVSESLLLPGSDLDAIARELRAADASGELHDEAAFIAALDHFEAGRERASWRHLGAIARLSPTKSNMARHAAALVSDPHQNPYGTFLAERTTKQRREAVWYVFGDIRMPRYKALPQAAGYAMAIPRLAQAAVTAPLRHLMQTSGVKPDFERGMAISAYRYLDRNPEGAHSRELIAWLYEYEEGRGHFHRALRLADFQPGFPAAKRLELVEKTGGQTLTAAGKIRRRDLRSTLLRNLARDYPDSEAGAAAGTMARTEVEEGFPQSIRMTRGFLYENPAVAGPYGLGLRAEYVDGELANGELHPRGVTFLGGRIIEFDFVDANASEDDEPHRVKRPISQERLARTIAVLEESTFETARIDQDAVVEADARRDLYFERARLGLTETIDHRPAAQSTYVYESLREKYGMVRSRESILPFDLVFQGSLGDLSLGAFPRWRTPKPTPDAFLYR